MIARVHAYCVCAETKFMMNSIHVQRCLSQYCGILQKSRISERLVTEFCTLFISSHKDLSLQLFSFDIKFSYLLHICHVAFCILQFKVHVYPIIVMIYIESKFNDNCSGLRITDIKEIDKMLSNKKKRKEKQYKRSYMDFRLY